MVHGLSIPIGKLGYHLSVPRFVTRAVDAESTTLPESVAVRGSSQYEGQILRLGDPQYPERRASDGTQLTMVLVGGHSRAPGTGVASQRRNEN